MLEILRKKKITLVMLKTILHALFDFLEYQAKKKKKKKSKK
jgi:hypothetical protein